MYLVPEKGVEIVNRLSKAELEQVSFYKRIAQQANRLGFLRAEKFFIAESKEENGHFLGWQDYMNGRGNDFIIPAIDEQDFKAKSLFELIELAIEKEIEVTKLYNEAHVQLMSIDVSTAIKCIEYINIQTEALAYYTDAYSVFKGLDKAGQLVAEHSFFEG